MAIVERQEYFITPLYRQCKLRIVLAMGREQTRFARFFCNICVQTDHGICLGALTLQNDPRHDITRFKLQVTAAAFLKSGLNRGPWPPF